MSPMYDFVCEKCGETRIDVIVKHDEIVTCCDESMKKLPCKCGWYAINGDNSASQTPHKFRKNNVKFNHKKWSE